MTACMAEYGPRFDTVGAVTAVARDGQSFCAREGLIDEFNIQGPLSPPGYDEARPGEPFVKIGVGELIRADDTAYRFSQPYIVRQYAPVTAERHGDVLTVSQSLRTEGGWGYEYHKTYRVQTAAATLVIEYALTNTGTRTIHAEQYNHNWFNFGGDPINEHYSLETEFDLVDHDAEWFGRSLGRLTLTGCVTQARYFPSPQSAPVHANSLHVGHATRGQAVVVSGDFSVARFALFADHTALCPEVFAEITLAPGQSRTWKRHYQFLLSSKPLHAECGEKPAKEAHA